MSTNVHLTPELEAFAKSCVAEGRYNNVSEVVRSSLRLLQEREERRRSFDRMIAEVRKDVEENGVYSLEEILAEGDAIIAAAEK